MTVTNIFDSADIDQGFLCPKILTLSWPITWWKEYWSTPCWLPYLDLLIERL